MAEHRTIPPCALTADVMTVIRKVMPLPDLPSTCIKRGWKLHRFYHLLVDGSLLVQRQQGQVCIHVCLTAAWVPLHVFSCHFGTVVCRFRESEVLSWFVPSSPDGCRCPGDRRSRSSPWGYTQPSRPSGCRCCCPGSLSRACRRPRSASRVEISTGLANSHRPSPRFGPRNRRLGGQGPEQHCGRCRRLLSMVRA